MKIKELTIGAVIPTAQYSNLQPSITIEVGEDEIEQAKAEALKHIEGISQRYAESGKALSAATPALKGQKLTCFVGGEIYFNEADHVYFNEQGEVYLSGSQYARQFEKPFDARMIASKMAAKNNVDVEEILAVWQAKSRASTTFGNALHTALELTQAHQSVCETLEKQYHVEYHPTLKTAVESFLEAHRLLPMQSVVCEAVVVDHARRYVGTIDRLIITGDKRCVIGDYKTNANLTLEKITGYQHQLSFYAAILQANGWEVEGLELYNWTGEKWVDHPMDVVKIKEARHG